MLASSDNSGDEAAAGIIGFNGGLERPLQQSLFSTTNLVGSYRDLYTTNPLDAGMRVELPGAEGAREQYFIRVRGNGDSTGQYQLQIRLRETDEFAGSTIRYSDIRYANIAVDVEGLVAHSPLIGEGALTGTDTLDLGNIGNSDRAAISVSGNLDSATAVNRFAFQLSRDSLQPSSGVTAFGRDSRVSLGDFDLDYADGLSRRTPLAAVLPWPRWHRHPNVDHDCA